MGITVAHLWDEYIAKSFVEVHPLLLSRADVRSISLSRLRWDNGEQPLPQVYSFKLRPMDGLIQQSFVHRAGSFLERRFLRGSFLRWAEDLIQEESVDLIHVHFGFTAAQFPELLQRKPFLVTFYGSDVSRGLRSRSWRKKFEAILPQARMLLVLCEEAKERLVSLGCSQEKIRIWNLPAGVEKYPLRAPLKESMSGNDYVKLIMAARFVPKKGHDLVISAIKVLRGEFPKLYYGLLKNHHLYVLPSITSPDGDDEGGPALTMVCAQAAGLPVLATRFPGSEITLRPGENGLAIERPTTEGVVEAVRKMMAIRGQWEEMGRRGSALANAQFGEREQTERLLQHYKDCISQR